MPIRGHHGPPRRSLVLVEKFPVAADKPRLICHAWFSCKSGNTEYLPAIWTELVVIMNESGKDGWELVTVVAVTDYHPLTLIQPKIEVQPEEAEEMVQLEAFRYIFKRPAA